MSTQTSIYEQECYDLARTIKIKSKILANNIELNAAILLGKAGWENTPKETWRYYLNLNGQYHLLDEMMTVVSLDTQKEINFTKESLELHPTTKREYHFGTSYYNDLVNRYPDQEHLIISILNPVDIQEAIAAEDLTILWYNELLVEGNESNLISRLQNFLYDFANAWTKTAYLNIDTYQTIKWFWEISIQVFIQILTIRLDNCRTEYAHSFHIWSYLDGYQKLGQYKSALTNRQVRYLYHNIERIQNNAGKNEIFDELVQVFFTERNIPLYNYYARHNIGQQVELCCPDTKLIRTTYGEEGGVVTANNISTIEKLMDREVSTSKDKGATLNKDTEETKEDFNVSNFDKVRTRVYEVETKITTVLQDVSIEEWLVDMWAILASNEYYQTTIAFENPINGELLSLSIKDAFIFYLYCYYRFLGVELEYIPVYWTRMGYNPNNHSKEDLAKTIPSGFLPSGYLDQMLADRPIIRTVATNSLFYELVLEVYNRWDRHIREFRSIENIGGSSIGNILASNLYSSWRIDLVGAKISYKDWLFQKNINITGFDVSHFKELASYILSNATGLSENTDVSSRTIQTAMVNIVRQLSAYNLQFLEVQPQDTTMSMARKAVRFDKMRTFSQGTELTITHGIFSTHLRGPKTHTLDNYLKIETVFNCKPGELSFTKNSVDIQNTDLNQTLKLDGLSRSTDMGMLRGGIYLSGLEII